MDNLNKKGKPKGGAKEIMKEDFNWYLSNRCFAKHQLTQAGFWWNNIKGDNIGDN